jgi:RNA polymerase sigma-70 factor (ECF subfamily)
MDYVTELHSVSGLYEEHRSSLVRFATALVGPSDAQDAVSEAMASLLKGGSLPEAQNPRALMYTAVLAKGRSMQRSWYRRLSRERAASPRESVVQEAPNVRPDVLDAVLRLSMRQRACVYLTYWEDLTPGQIADRLGLGEGTVKKYLARARAHLREVLDE